MNFKTVGVILSGACVASIAVYAASSTDRSANVESKNLGEELGQLRKDSSLLKGKVAALMAKSGRAAADDAPQPARPEAQTALAGGTAQTEARPLLPPVELRRRLGQHFLDEAPDPSWARQVERTLKPHLQQMLPGGSQLRSAECRSTLCRAEIVHPDVDTHRDFLQKFMLNTGWSGAATWGLKSTLADGRAEAEFYFFREGEEDLVAELSSEAE